MNGYKVASAVALIVFLAGCGSTETSCHPVGTAAAVVLRPPASIDEITEFDVRLCQRDRCHTTTMVATDSGFEVKGCVEECDPQSAEEITLPHVAMTSEPLPYSFIARDAEKRTIMYRSGSTEGVSIPPSSDDPCEMGTFTSTIDLSDAK